jgi:diadenylate cyclase
VSSFASNARIFLGNVGWRDIIDVLIVAFILYQLLKLIRGTQAAQLVVGLVVLLFIGFAAGQLHLRLLDWVFSNGGQAILIAAVILFQPELRRALDQVGRLSPVRAILAPHGAVGVVRVVEEVMRAAVTLSEKRTGALLVFERETGLENVASTGVRINGEITAEMLATIFFPSSPLHDGAVVIHDGRLISVANEGKVYRGLDQAKLQDMLLTLLGGVPTGGRLLIPRPFLRSSGARAARGLRR